jgi:hypothetical protein
VKYLLTLVLIAIVNSAGGQQPAGVNNSIILGENEGYEGFNYAVIFHSSSGKVYTHTYAGETAIHGNNYTLPLRQLSGNSATPTFFLEVSKDTILYCDSKEIAVISNDSVVQLVTFPIEASMSTTYKQGVIAILKEGNHSEILFFDGKTLKVNRSKSNIPITPQSGLQKSPSGNIYFSNTIGDSLIIYHLDIGKLTLTPLKSYAVGSASFLKVKDENNLLIQKTDNKATIIRIKNGQGEQLNPTDNEYIDLLNLSPEYPYGLSSKKAPYIQIENTLVLESSKNLPTFLSQDVTHLACSEQAYGSFYASTANKPIRIFKNIKKYPLLFNNNNTSACFAIQEDFKGNIWAGSYQSALSKITDNKVWPVQEFTQRIENGSTRLNQYLYFIAEGAKTGLIQINHQGKIRQLVSSTTGFYAYPSKDKQRFYYGTNNYNGLWETDVRSLEKGKPQWNKIDSTKGILLNNILTITEDKIGRIWCAHPRRGIAIYDPLTKTAKTWLVEKKEISFGAFCSITDNKGTVWMGSANTGLWYFNDYHQSTIPLACKQIIHPLLNSGKPLTALCLFENWLIIAATDKVLLLNLDSFYLKNKTFLRYLNPREASFTSVTEQNTLLTASDSTIWFSTSDMLYQWNIKDWLKNTTYKVTQSVAIINNGNERKIIPQQEIQLEPELNSFEISLHYLSPDNLPRYARGSLLKDGDTLDLPVPGIVDKWDIRNIGTGHYHFVLEIFEMDGKISKYSYPIVVNQFLWQHWWFWAMLSSVIIGSLFYFYNLRKKIEIAEQRTKSNEAELKAFKSDQEKKIANLRLVTLSSQFRPHFILNALNSIGAQLDDNPGAESVLSRLGESVNIIFGHSQQQKILHAFEDEWRLVNNVIHIHRLMYLKKLEFKLPTDLIVRDVQFVQIPLGILQIPVENALLHGLSNKEMGPWVLEINIEENSNSIIIEIIDNGVGRKRSARMSNFSKHGTGTKNLTGIIDIINAENTSKISISHEDDIFNDQAGGYGTKVIIDIPKNISYGK